MFHSLVIYTVLNENKLTAVGFVTVSEPDKQIIYYILLIKLFLSLIVTHV